MIVLASASPWRKKLWEFMNEDVVVVPSGVEEYVDEEVEPEELVCSLAAAKARQVYGQLMRGEPVVNDAGEIVALDERYWVIGADTMIYHQGTMIGKPDDRADAAEIIKTLSSDEHAVCTGVCVIDEVGEQLVDVTTTKVRFGSMSEEQLENYLNTHEWEGKAGGYQILGAIQPHVHDIQGSVSGVIGMPMKLTVDLLERLGCVVDMSSEQRMMEAIGYLD